ncbi:MAG: nickel pincer cofactor biosynthesis protein LarC [Firmicutes bacterium]|nr:nickel pincer cofactor biosynthesis protein LarC [Bacillota bacterium]
MTIAYFNCSSGVSGDMIVGALLHAGMPLDYLRSELEKLALPGVSVSAEPAVRAHLAGVRFYVNYPKETRARHLSDIAAIINRATLAQRVKERALAVFSRLAQAEAKVHNVDVDHVHFHEVGAADAIVDIVGACLGLEYFGVDEVYSSSINVGGGTVVCEHGTMPVPAPATAELLKGVSTYSTGEIGELATPTGSAVLSALAARFGQQPAMVVRSVGYGAGAKDLAIPNLLRVSIGEPADSATSDDALDNEIVTAVAEALGAQTDSVIVIETEIDDMNPEALPELVQKVMSAGALDVHHSPVSMKHGRPGLNLSAICDDNSLELVARCLFEQSTTFGIRTRRANRIKLQRTIVKVDTKYGQIGVKVGYLASRAVTASPEHRDCAEAARKSGVSVIEVYDEAKAAFRALQTRPNS